MLEKGFGPEAKAAVAVEVGTDENATKPVVLADRGYWSEQDLKSEEVSGYRVIVPPDRFGNYRAKGEAKPLSSNAPRSEYAEAMRAFLKTKEGQRLYVQRQSSVEPVFGQTKHCRGIRGFLLRGQRKVKGEWNLISLAHNLLKLFRYQTARMAA